VISSFSRDADEDCALLGYYAASTGNFLSAFRDNLSVPSSNVKNPRRLVVISYRCLRITYRSHLQGPLKMGPIDSPETSVRNYHYLLLNRPEERSSHIWLKSVDWSVFHFCLNSVNIRETV